MRKKIKKIYNDNTSAQYSSLIFVPIFTPLDSRLAYSDKEIILDVKRTQNERIRYKGPKLDLTHDYQLFAFLVSRMQQNNDSLVAFESVEVMDYLEIPSKHRNKRRRDIIERRLKKLTSCQVEIVNLEICEFSSVYTEHSSLYFNLVNSVERNIGLDMFFVEMNKHLGLSDSLFEREIINIKKLNKLKNQYSRAIYLFLETRKFSGQIRVDHRVDDLISRFGISNMKDKEKRRILKNCIEEIKDVGLIQDACLYETSVQKIKTYKITR